MPATPTLTDLAPAIPRSAYTQFAHTAAQRLDWHKRETALNAHAARNGIARAQVEQLLRNLMDSAEWQGRIWDLDDLFETATASVTLIAAGTPGDTLTDIADALYRAAHDHSPTPAPLRLRSRTMATAWARFVHTHPERPELRPRHA